MQQSWLRVLVGAVIGLIVGLGIRTSGVGLPPWRKLPRTASPVIEVNVELAGVNSSGSCGRFRTADGSTLRLSQGTSGNWLPTSDTGECHYDRLMKPCNSLFGENCQSPYQPIHPVPCDLSSEAFSALTFPPSNVKTCVEYDLGYVDSSWIRAYAVDSSGVLWQWDWNRINGNIDNTESNRQLMLGLAPLCLPIVGIMLGVWIIPRKD